MDSYERVFLDNYRRYNDYRKTNVLPPKIALKLDYLARTILNESELSAEIKEAMNRDEVDALDTMDIPTKLQLFVSISDCLFGKSSPAEARQAYIRPNKYLSFWELCYISYDSENLYLTTTKKESHSLSCVKVLKHIRRKSAKYVLNLEINKANMLIAFLKERHALKLYRALTDPYQDQQTMNAPTILGISNLSNIDVSFNKTKVKSQRVSIGEIVQEKPPQLKHVSIHDIEEVRSVESEKEEDSPGKQTAQQDENVSIKEITPQSKDSPREVSALEKQLTKEFELDTILEDDCYRVAEVLKNSRILSLEAKPSVCKLCTVLESANLPLLLTLLCDYQSWHPEVE